MITQIGLLARSPSATGKTRLVEGLPPARARALKAALLADTTAVVRSTGFPLTVFFTPGEARDELTALLGAGVRLEPQASGDLGARMEAAAACCFARGACRVVLVGSDLPSLPARFITQAVSRLADGDEVVLGPAEDGGYYLIGLSRPAPVLFTGMRWGEADVLARTLVAAGAASLRVGLVETWYDVDRRADLERLARGEEPAARTRAWLAEGGR